jgi:hypothetical protein
LINIRNLTRSERIMDRNILVNSLRNRDRCGEHDKGTVKKYKKLKKHHTRTPHLNTFLIEEPRKSTDAFPKVNQQRPTPKRSRYFN